MPTSAMTPGEGGRDIHRWMKTGRQGAVGGQHRAARVEASEGSAQSARQMGEQPRGHIHTGGRCGVGHTACGPLLLQSLPPQRRTDAEGQGVEGGGGGHSDGVLLAQLAQLGVACGAAAAERGQGECLLSVETAWGVPPARRAIDWWAVEEVGTQAPGSGSAGRGCPSMQLPARAAACQSCNPNVAPAPLSLGRCPPLIHHPQDSAPVRGLTDHIVEGGPRGQVGDEHVVQDGTGIGQLRHSTQRGAAGREGRVGMRARSGGPGITPSCSSCGLFFRANPRVPVWARLQDVTLQNAAGRAAHLVQRGVGVGGHVGEAHVRGGILRGRPGRGGSGAPGCPKHAVRGSPAQHNSKAAA